MTDALDYLTSDIDLSGLTYEGQSGSSKIEVPPGMEYFNPEIAKRIDPSTGNWMGFTSPEEAAEYTKWNTEVYAPFVTHKWNAQKTTFGDWAKKMLGTAAVLYGGVQLAGKLGAGTSAGTGGTSAGTGISTGAEISTGTSVGTGVGTGSGAVGLTGGTDVAGATLLPSGATGTAASTTASTVGKDLLAKKTEGWLVKALVGTGVSLVGGQMEGRAIRQDADAKRKGITAAAQKVTDAEINQVQPWLKALLGYQTQNDPAMNAYYSMLGLAPPSQAGVAQLLQGGAGGVGGLPTGAAGAPTSGGNYMNLFAGTPWDLSMEGFKKSPQWNVMQAEQGDITNSLSKKYAGRGTPGSFGRELERYGTQLATQNYGNYADRSNALRNEYQSGLLGVAGGGIQGKFVNQFVRDMISSIQTAAGAEAQGVAGASSVGGNAAAMKANLESYGDIAKIWALFS